MQCARHFWLIVCLLIVLLAGCSSAAPLVKKPTALPASPTSAPANTPGGPGCQPASPAIVPRGNETSAGVGLPQVEGKAPGGQLWALIFNGWPMQTGNQNKIVWRMTGSGNLELVAYGPDGRMVHPADVTLHEGSSWQRPGDEWGSVFVFPSAGCWNIHATRENLAGDVWVMVVHSS